jgi:hypothetical protein
MYKRNVSKLLITMVESNFISSHDYEYIVCSIFDYNPDKHKKKYATEDEFKGSYEDEYGLDVGGWAHWKCDMDKHKLVLKIDSTYFKFVLEITPDELDEIWKGYDLDILGKKLALGYIESYISNNKNLSLEGLNAVIPSYEGLCYAEVTDSDELVVVFDHNDFYIEHFFPNILASGSKNDLHSTYRNNCEWRLT